MRQSDENKRKAIGDAAINLIITVGFSDTSMSRIAREAKVSPATIYTYFENKEDMLNKLYLMVKRNFSDCLLKGFDPQMPIKEGLRLIFNNVCNSFKANPKHFIFMEFYASSPLVNKISKELATAYYKPIYSFIERGKKEKVLKDVPSEMISAYCFYPIANMLKSRHNEGRKLNEKELENIFLMMWNAVKL